MSRSLATLARIRAGSGDEQAAASLRAAIEHSYETRLWFDLWPTLEAFAGRALEHPVCGSAAYQVFGYLDQQHLGTVDSTSRRSIREQAEADTGNLASYRHGQLSDRDEIVTLVLASLEAQPEQSH